MKHILFVLQRCYYATTKTAPIPGDTARAFTLLNQHRALLWCVPSRRIKLTQDTRAILCEPGDLMFLVHDVKKGHSPQSSIIQIG